MKETVGILLDHNIYAGIPLKRTGYERIDLYDKAAKKLELTPFFMSLETTGKTVAHGYTLNNGQFRFEKRAIPKVIHNRVIAGSPFLVNKLSMLAQSSIVFNRINRFGKLHITRILQKNPSFRQYIPRTWIYSRENLQRAMISQTALYIKPSNGSVGNGIVKISKGKKGLWSIFWKKGAPLIRTHQNTIAFIEQMTTGRSYLIQEAIPLALYQGRPYDLRVSVQRGSTGAWQVTGMVGKVAAKDLHVTNVAKGGMVKPCEELFQASGFPVEFTKKKVSRFSLQIATYLGKRLPHLADVGFDIGVSHKGEVKFIEMNGRDQRITFHKAGMSETYFNTYLTPLHYAKSLMKPKAVTGKKG